MKVIPERTENIGLSREERLFAALMRGQLLEDDLLLLQINPFGRLGMTCHAAISGYGLLLVQVSSSDNVDAFLESISTLLARLESMRGALMARIWQKDALLDADSDLRFEVLFRFAFPRIRINTIPELPTDQRLFLEKYCLFYDDFDAMSAADGQYLRRLFGDVDPCLSPADIDLILHSIAPEYTIPRPIPPSRNGFLEPAASIARVNRLDDAQIQNLFLIDQGHYILLAEAGSSKSALLISSCLRQASLHPDRQYLLLCYNRNLCRFFRWQLEIAGYGNRNIHCMPFHKLCANLLDKNGIKWRRRFTSREEADEVAALEAFQAMQNGEIADRFDGLFIDEIQVFRQEWYKLCYSLLKSHEAGEYIFVISGDRTQTLENRMRGGRAPWQGDRSFPSYRGRSLRLPKNYRNTAEIADFVREFLSLARKSCVEMGIEDEMPRMDERFRSEPFRHGSPPRLKLLVEKSTEREAEQIILEIRRMNQRGIELEEIAVLLFHLQYARRLDGWEEPIYAIEPVLTAHLEEQGIPYARFYGEDRAVYGRHTGVSLLTFDGALGLDYRGVIVAGMRAMGEHFHTKSEKSILEGGVRENSILNFLQNVNAIAVACTRARDDLSIVLPEEYGDSIYSRLLIDANLR